MKRLFKVAAVIVVLLIAAVAAVPFFVDANTFRPELESRLTAGLGRKVTLGDLKLTLLKGAVTAKDITIADDPAYSTSSFIKADSLNFGVDLWSLILSRQLNVKEVTLNQPRIVLLQDKDGKWNFSSIGQTASGSTASATPEPGPTNPAVAPSATPGSPMQLSLHLLRIADGEITMGSTRKGDKPSELKDIALEVKDFMPAAAFPFTLKATVVGGGDIVIDGKVGPIAPVASDTPFDAQVKLTGLNLVGSGFVESDANINGLISFNGKLTSDGTRITVDGPVKGEQLKLAKGGSPAKPVVEIDVNLIHDMSTRKGILKPTPVKLGSAKGSLNGTYDLSEDRPVLSVEFAGKDMPLTELMSLLPALDIVLPTGATLQGGTLTAELAAHGPTDRLLSTGSLNVSKAKIGNYNLGSKLKVIQQMAGMKDESSTEFETVAAKYDIAAGGTTVKDLRIVAPSIGDLTGLGTISPDHTLNFTMQAKLKTGGFLAAAIGQRGDTTTIPFFIRGNSSNPSFQADVKSVANEKLQQAIKNPAGAVKTVQGILDSFRKTKPDSGK